MNIYTQIKAGIAVVILLGIIIICLVLYSLFRKPEVQATELISTQATPVTSTQESSDNRQVKFSEPARVSLKKDITVPANQMWFDTGMDVTGKTVRIEYKSGQWLNIKGSNWCDGEGKGPWTGMVVPDAPLASLVGKTDKGTFYVGNYIEGKMGSGRLYLSMNDKPGTYDDGSNSGSLNVTVSFLDK